MADISRRTTGVVGARRELKALREVVAQLASSLLPGTARPWRAPQVSAERRAELDRLDRELRAHFEQQGDLPAHLKQQRTAIPPGESPAPLDLDVMDLLAEIFTAIDRLTEKTARHVEQHLIGWAGGWARTLPSLAPPAATSAFSDPRPALLLLDALLSEIRDEELLNDIADSCSGFVSRAQETLGLVVDGQLLKALCPSCGGKTGAHPVGGAQTLRIRTLGASRSDGGRPIVVCEGGRCEPTSAESGLRWRGLPAWDLANEGNWLADWITKADQERDDAKTAASDPAPALEPVEESA